MIPTYGIEDFSPFYEKEKQFVIVPFENLKRPVSLTWPHKHSFYEILWIRKGRSKHFVDNEERDLSRDTIYFMSPGQTHHFEKYEAVTGDSIMFTEEFFILNFTNKEAIHQLSFLHNNYNSPNIILDKCAKDTLEPVLKLIYDEFARADYSKITLSSLLFVFFNYLQRVYFIQHNNRQSTLNNMATFDKFKRLLEENFKDQRPLSYYASMLFVTPHHLNEIIKKVAGKTASEMVKDRVLLEAKRMLVQSHFPIGRIADELGFKDFSYFSRQFKKHNQLSPEQYRNTMIEKYQF